MCRPRRTQIRVGLPLETPFKLKSNIKEKHISRIAIEESIIPIQNYQEAGYQK